MVVVAVFLGTLFGALPGVSGTMAVTLGIPFTYSMSMEYGMPMLMGIYCSAVYGGSISAILLNTPGTPAAAATVIVKALNSSVDSGNVSATVQYIEQKKAFLRVGFHCPKIMTARARKPKPATPFSNFHSLTPAVIYTMPPRPPSMPEISTPDQTLVGTAMNLLGTAAATVFVKAMNTAESVDNVSSTIQYINAKKAFLVNLGGFEFNWFMLLAGGAVRQELHHQRAAQGAHDHDALQADSSQISDFISALIIYLCGFVLFFKTALNAWLNRRDEKKKAEKGGG